jgi:hypothetical protein
MIPQPSTPLRAGQALNPQPPLINCRHAHTAVNLDDIHVACANPILPGIEVSIAVCAQCPDRAPLPVGAVGADCVRPLSTRTGARSAPLPDAARSAMLADSKLSQRKAGTQLKGHAR